MQGKSSQSTKIRKLGKKRRRPPVRPVLSCNPLLHLHLPQTIRTARPEPELFPFRRTYFWDKPLIALFLQRPPSSSKLGVSHDSQTNFTTFRHHLCRPETSTLNSKPSHPEDVHALFRGILVLPSPQPLSTQFQVTARHFTASIPQTDGSPSTSRWMLTDNSLSNSQTAPSTTYSSRFLDSNSPSCPAQFLNDGALDTTTNTSITHSSYFRTASTPSTSQKDVHKTKGALS